MSENKAKIFMVDDDADLVMIVRSVFLTEGYEFDSANSAKEALEKLDDVNPDLMILDVMMEDMVAGFRVVNALRDFTANPKNKKYENMPFWESIHNAISIPINIDIIIEIVLIINV